MKGPNGALRFMGIKMDFVFKDLVTKCWWSWVSLLVAVVLLVVVAVGTASGWISGPGQGWLGMLAYTALCFFFAKPLLVAAYAGHKHLPTVCIWTGVLVGLFIVMSIHSFYAFFGKAPAHYDKVLNVIPVVVAIWAAGLGWLVHFRLTSKAHRTNNAFSIIMEMRKSSEFLKRVELVSRHFPPGSVTIPNEYNASFGSSTLHDLYKTSRETGQEIDALALERAEAIMALKYVLNYYEFMSVGIKEGDLDEELLYETIGPMVVRTFDRSANLIRYVNVAAPAGAGQPLAFTELRKVVNRWRVRVNNDTAKQANGA